MLWLKVTHIHDVFLPTHLSLLKLLTKQLSMLNIWIPIFFRCPLRKKRWARRLASVQRFCHCMHGKVCATVDSDSSFGIGLGIAVTHCSKIPFFKWVNVLFLPFTAAKHIFESLSKSEIKKNRKMYVKSLSGRYYYELFNNIFNNKFKNISFK